MSTKIVATIGPRSESPEMMNSLMKAGVDVVRVNFSHATPEQYKSIKNQISTFNKVNNRKVAILLDLQGPRIRVGKMPSTGLVLKKGETYRFTYSTKPYEDEGIIPIDNSELAKEIKKGEPLFLCNGGIESKVVGIKNGVISAKVTVGGLLLPRKGINVPDTNLRAGGLTDKDIKDLKYGLKIGADYVGLSFVQTEEDVLRLKKLIGKSKAKIVSKIERGIALKNIDKIIAASDAIMIARGDLGIEIPIEELPIVQKNLVRHAHWHNKPAILATQVMISMMDHASPTRAEVSDIANAVFDGADMIMLSDETAMGAYPLEAVKILKKVIDRTESSIYKRNVAE
ncbi:MAG: pyruvate kinase [Candidatus Falkowbacteria bacterium]|nr:pyruvate kinase [Candidatus Falkowbacteria bacterium]